LGLPGSALQDDRSPMIVRVNRGRVSSRPRSCLQKRKTGWRKSGGTVFLVFFLLFFFLQRLADALQPLNDPCKDGPFGVGSVLLQRASGNPGEGFDPLFHSGNRIDVELPGLDGVDDFVGEHQVVDVLGRDEHPLVSIQTLGLADLEETFDLLIDAADRLDVPFLVDRSGDGNSLFDGKIGQTRQKGVELVLEALSPSIIE